jgi:hypothetical protein
VVWGLKRRDRDVCQDNDCVERGYWRREVHEPARTESKHPSTNLPPGVSNGAVLSVLFPIYRISAPLPTVTGNPFRLEINGSVSVVGDG